MSKEFLYIAMELWGTIFSLILAINTRLLWGQRFSEYKMLFLLELCNAGMLLSDSLAWYFRGNADAIVILQLSTFFAFAFAIVSPLPFLLYIYKSAGKRTWRKAPFYIICATICFSFSLLILTQHSGLLYSFDASNIYHRNNRWYWLIFTSGVLAVVTNAVQILRNRCCIQKSRLYALVITTVLPLLALLGQPFLYGFSISNIATTIGIVCCYIEAQHSQSNLLKDLQIRIALSQIKPHFLYNALNSIHALCGINIQQGRKALCDFSDYLRMNITSIETAHVIPFSRELEHIKVYLSLEQLRFGDRLKIEYQIQTELFNLPPLTVQPLVENAVKHGICRKESGGTVTISTREEKKAFIITVQDDGVGFNPAAIKKSCDCGIGIQNVRERLKIHSQGQLCVNSKPGAGTKAVIMIPKL
ncbi:MAG: histidine kinase [Treponema sp.]|nr:histidine kinase [Treponema sp.]